MEATHTDPYIGPAPVVLEENLTHTRLNDWHEIMVPGDSWRALAFRDPSVSTISRTDVHGDTITWRLARLPVRS